MTQKTYTQEQLDIEILKQKNEDFHRSFERIYKLLDRIESQQKWMFSLIGSALLGLLGLIAHGFHWIQ